VVQKQLGLVDFLESQRYRITYYANKMASSVGPEHLAVIFGTDEQNQKAITHRVQATEDVRAKLVAMVDGLAPDEFDRDTFQPTRKLAPEKRKRLDALLYEYQAQRNALDMAKKRLQLVRSAKRSSGAVDDANNSGFDANLLVGQMFGTLDRIRLQMSMDLLYLENLVSGYARTSRTQEILQAFQSLIDMQGDLEGPSPELAGILDWLQDSSTRRISLGAANLSSRGLQVPHNSDLLRSAYLGTPSKK